MKSYVDNLNHNITYMNNWKLHPYAYGNQRGREGVKNSLKPNFTLLYLLISLAIQKFGEKLAFL